jgi:hypothetical protein
MVARVLARVVPRWEIAVLVCAVAAQGCSSSGSSSGSPEAGPACPVDASIATFTFPDAALGDSGSTAVSCGACLNTSCIAYVQACDNDCSCLEATKNVLECGQDGGTALTCSMMYGSSEGNFTQLALCILENCEDVCNLNGVLDAGAEGSVATTEASTADGGSDATLGSSDAATSDATSEAATVADSGGD